jgi:hypothetical protein
VKNPSMVIFGAEKDFLIIISTLSDKKKPSNSVSGAIIGGGENADEAGSYVFIQNSVSVCGGVLISEFDILTSATCILP